jgi:hypothetical protein
MFALVRAQRNTLGWIPLTGALIYEKSPRKMPP